MDYNFIKEKLISSYKYQPNLIYLNRYIKFCLTLKEKNRILEYTHRHHILPKGVDEFKIYESNVEWNIVKLTPREHYIAHKMLALAFPKRRVYVSAFVYCSAFYTVSSRDYETLQILKSELNKNSRFVNKSGEIKYIDVDEIDDYLNNGWRRGYGRKYKKVMKEDRVRAVEKHKLQEYLNNGWELYDMKNKFIRVYRKIDDNIYENIAIPKTELEDHLNNGWLKGVSPDIKGTRGKIRIFKRNKNIFYQTMVEKSQLNDYIKEGYKVGLCRSFTKNKISFIKFIDGILVKIIINKKYNKILLDNGWGVDEIDLKHNNYDNNDERYFTILNERKIINYVENINIYPEVSLLSQNKDKINIHHKELNLKSIINKKYFNDFKNFGWERGTNFNPHKDVTPVFKYINGEVKSKFINRTDLNKWLNLGWERGTGKSNVNNYKHVHKIENNEYIRKMIKQEEYDQYIKDGWLPGRGKLPLRKKS